MNLVGIPVRNEIESLPTLIRELRGSGYDLFVVDNCSTDGTRELLRGHGVNCLLKSENTEVGDSLRSIFEFAKDRGYSSLITMDAGSSHNPVDIPFLLEALNPPFELAIGSRFLPSSLYQTVPWRRLLSRLGTIAFNLRFDTRYSDVTSGFRAYSKNAIKRVLEAFPGSVSGYAFQIASLRLFAPPEVIEVPISYERSGSSLRAWKILEALRELR